jgi:hypothetical protein
MGSRNFSSFSLSVILSKRKREKRASSYPREGASLHFSSCVKTMDDDGERERESTHFSPSSRGAQDSPRGRVAGAWSGRGPKGLRGNRRCQDHCNDKETRSKDRDTEGNVEMTQARGQHNPEADHTARALKERKTERKKDHICADLSRDTA